MTPGFGPNASSTNRIYFYDVYTNTFSNHLPTPGGNAYWPNRKGACIIGNDLLMLDGAAVLRYNLMTYELAEVLTVNNVSYTGLFNINEQLGILLDMEICLVSNDNSVYSENTLVILQGKYKMTNREIVLFSLPETSMGKLYFPFNDIFPYINGEFMINIPTYYGNGTEWIKYKN